MEKISEYLTGQFDLSQEYQHIMQDIVLQDPEIQSFLAKADLPDAVVKRGASKLYEFVMVKKQIQEKRPTMMQGYKPKLSVINQRIELSYEPTTEFLEQQKQQEIKKRIRLFNNAPLKSKQLVGFKDIDLEEASRLTPVQAVFDFYQAYLKEPKKFHKGLYLHGRFGTGKTFLMNVLANELAKKGYTSLLVYYPDFIVKMKEAINTSQTGKLLDSLKLVDILIIDEIGSVEASNWFRDECLGPILQYRMEQDLPTFFTSNLPMSQLEKALSLNSRNELEPLKAKRIMERIAYLAKEYEIVGVNRRKL